MNGSLDHVPFEELTPGQQLARGFSDLHDAFLQEYEHRRAMDKRVEELHTASGFVSLDDLIEMYAHSDPSDRNLRRQATEDVVRSQLKTPTRRSIYDSAGTAGRGWERDAARTFDNEDPSPFRVRNGELSHSHNTWHWMTEKLFYEPRWTYFFHNVYDPAVDPENDMTWFALGNKFYEFLSDLGFELEETKPCVTGTCNFQNMLDHWLEIRTFTITYVPDQYQDVFATGVIYLVMVHNGGDPRYGGWTRPIMYSAQDRWDDDGYLFYSTTDGAVYCTHCDAHWDTQDAGYRYEPGYNKTHHIPNFDEVKWVEDWEIEDDEELEAVVVEMEEQRRWDEAKANTMPLNFSKPVKTKPVRRERYVSIVDSDTHIATCPVCRIGKLQGGF